MSGQCTKSRDKKGGFIMENLELQAELIGETDQKETRYNEGFKVSSRK